MRFIYEITSFPAETIGYSLTAYTEGILRVRIGSSLYLDACDILLVEYAVVLQKWLLSMKDEVVGFYYASMDFEEEPIFALHFNPKHSCFFAESVWAKSDPVPVSPDDAKEAARTYLDKLRAELRVKHCVDLDKTIEEAISE